jgi:hypothetical protein
MTPVNYHNADVDGSRVSGGGPAGSRRSRCCYFRYFRARVICFVVISQNGNAYEEGLSEGWNPISSLLDGAFGGAAEGVACFPLSRNDDLAIRSRPPIRQIYARELLFGAPGADEIKLDLFGDYKSNVALYPEFQSYSARTVAVPGRVGKNDGAEAFRWRHGPAVLHSRRPTTLRRSRPRVSHRSWL